MAIWQFSFHLIPKEKYSIDGDEFSFEDIVDDFTWDDYIISIDSLNIVSLKLPSVKSWCDDIKQYGDLEGTCIELIYEENTLYNIHVRLDLSTISKQLLKDILLFAQINNSLIATNKKVIEPNFENLINEIKESRSFQYISSPLKFLDSIKD